MLIKEYDLSKPTESFQKVGRMILKDRVRWFFDWVWTFWRRFGSVLEAKKRRRSLRCIDVSEQEMVAELPPLYELPSKEACGLRHLDSERP